MRVKKSTPLLFILILHLIFPNFILAKERLAVMNLKAQHGVEKSIADALSVEVRNGIHDLGVYEVLSKEDLDVLAERTAIMQKVDCEATSQCLIDFGRSIGTKYMVAGSISKMGETYTINLRLLDTEGKNAGVKQRVGKQCKCSEDELINAAREVAMSVMQVKNEQAANAQGNDGLNTAEFQTATSLEQSEKQSSKEEKEGWFSKYKWWIAVGVLLVGGGAAAAGGGGGSSSDGGGTEQPAGTATSSATVSW